MNQKAETPKCPERRKKQLYTCIYAYFYKYINVILYSILKDYQNYNTWKNTNEDVTLPESKNINVLKLKIHKKPKRK